MDSPSTAISNVLKIDNLSRVPYTICSPTPPEDASSHVPHPLDDWQYNVLRDAERSLRLDAIPVLADPERGSLWIFHIHGVLGDSPKASTGHAVLEQPTVGQTLTPGERDARWPQLQKRLKEEWGLQESSTGVFLASSLILKSNPGPVIPPTQQNTSGHTPPAAASDADGRVTIDLTLDDPPETEGQPSEVEEIPQELLIYQKLISAVLSVVSFCLSRDGFTPLNTKTLVSPSSLPASENFKTYAERCGKDELLPIKPIMVPEIIAPLVLEIEAYMTSSGTLVIVPYSEKQPAIRRVSTCHFTPASLDYREVFVAPWGEWGRLVSPPEATSSLTINRSEEKWKELVISYLKDRGIVSPIPIEEPANTDLQETIEQGKWLYVEIWLPSLTDPSMGDLRRVLWPEALLFLRFSESDKTAMLPMEEDTEDAEIWKRVFDDPEYPRLASGKLAFILALQERDGVSDPKALLNLGAEWWDVQSALQWGLEWYQGREERAKKIQEAVEEQRRKEQAEGKAKEDKPAVKAVDKGKGKLGSDLRAGGVYPTPPDGPGSVLGGPASVPPTGVADINAFGSGGGNAMDVDWTGKPAKEASSVPQTAEAGLFDEEMDDMDALMKVTEDDFDFFDNPGFEAGKDAEGAAEMDLDMTAMDIQDVGDMAPTTEIDDIQMGTPPTAPGITPAVSVADLAQQSAQQDVKITDESDHGKAKAQTAPSNQVRTPPLSPHRAISLLVPGYESSTGATTASTSASGNYVTPSSGPTSVGTATGDGAAMKRKVSLYSPLAFTENVDMADRKYAPGGRFFQPDTIKPKEVKEEHPTKPDRSQPTKRKKLPVATGGGDLSTAPRTVESAMDDGNETTESDDETDYETESDADDTTEDEGSRYNTSPDPQNGPGFWNWTGTKRNLHSDKLRMESEIPGLPPSRDGVVGADREAQDIPDLAPAPWEAMQPDPLPESLIGVFQDMKLRSEALTLGSLNDTEFPEVAAIAAHQMSGWVNGTWNGQNETVSQEDEESIYIRRRKRTDQTIVENVVKMVFKEGAMVRCNLETYAAIVDMMLEPPPLPPPPPLSHFSRGNRNIKPNISQARNKDAEDPAIKTSDIFHIPPPHVRLQRGDNILEVLPPALHFWETFSLAPISGNKNVIAFCLYPASSSLEEGATFFLDRICSSYEAGRFGVHVRAQLDGLVKDGLVPVELPSDAPRTYDSGIKAFLNQIESYGSVFAHGVADEEQNIVVYVINPFSHPAAFVDISTAFVRMQRIYTASLSTVPEAKPNHLVLQVVPADFVANKLGGVMRVGIVHKLAVEVYNRCVQTDAGVSWAEASRATSPVIQLARPIPKEIKFELTTDPSPALLKENQLLHIVYNQSVDERWVAVAWSDPIGSLQKTALINLARPREPQVLKPFSDVISEIWDRTTELIRYPAVKWRLCIASLSPMLPDEVETWQSLAESHNRISATYLLRASSSPRVTLEQKLAELKMEDFNISAFANTPTPAATSAAAFSPDSAATPGENDGLDADSEIVDTKDNSWGVVLSHTRVDDGSGRNYQADGMLVRKDGGSQEGWRCTLTVGVVNAGVDGVDTSRKAREVVREVLEAWRGLTVLGNFQGGREGIPWVVSACEGVEKLGQVM